MSALAGSRRAAAFFSIACLLSGCATSPQPANATAAISGPNNTVSLATDAQQAALVLRELAPALSRNVALMHGVHTREVGPYDFRNEDEQLLLNTLIADAGLERFTNPAYDFLAPADYRRLNALELRSMLPANTSLPAASVAIGADTPLFDALALLGQALNTTLIADNAVAAARTGELALPNINGIDALEALLKSARIDQSAFNVQTGDNYILFHATGNPPRNDVIANRTALTETQRTLLDRPVTLRLPDPSAASTEVGAYASATTLGNILPTLTAQLGVTVTADPILYRFPVNPCRMTNVTTETALKLLINQWLVQDFVIEVRNASLHLRPQ